MSLTSFVVSSTLLAITSASSAINKYHPDFQYSSKGKEPALLVHLSTLLHKKDKILHLIFGNHCSLLVLTSFVHLLFNTKLTVWCDLKLHPDLFSSKGNQRIQKDLNNPWRIFSAPTQQIALPACLVSIQLWQT